MVTGGSHFVTSIQVDGEEGKGEDSETGWYGSACLYGFFLLVLYSYYFRMGVL